MNFLHQPIHIDKYTLIQGSPGNYVRAYWSDNHLTYCTDISVETLAKIASSNDPPITLERYIDGAPSNIRLISEMTISHTPAGDTIESITHDSMRQLGERQLGEMFSQEWGASDNITIQSRQTAPNKYDVFKKWNVPDGTKWNTSWLWSVALLIGIYVILTALLHSFAGFLGLPVYLVYSFLRKKYLAPKYRIETVQEYESRIEKERLTAEAMKELDEEFPDIKVSDT
jgi:hypothetical protein